MGPLGQSANAVRITPRRLKAYLDKYVIGQERAKKTLSVAVYSHYKRIDELILSEHNESNRIAAEDIQRKQYERAELMIAQSQPDFDAISRPDGPNEQPEPQRTVRYVPPVREPPPPRDPLADTNKVVLEKANVLCLGPTGVGKTHILKTLAKALEVPFSLSDCTPFTQAGYVGEDAAVCVERLLAASNWDVARAETGIICLDEIDKLAKTADRGSRDVGGAGVQQALLKIIEGTELTISAKGNRGNSRNGGVAGRFPSNYDNSPWQQQKPEEYTIRTDNILFICTGAFTGLQEVIMKRLAKGSLGFNAAIKDPIETSHQMVLSEEDAKEHFRSLPYYNKSLNTPPPTPPGQLPDPITYNPLDIVTPQDLQDYGMIPEFLGRIPITTALSPFSIPQLMRVLTEPRNSIISQYIQEFSISGTDLKFTSLALWEIAKAAAKLGTGARALRGIVENVLAEAKFEVPGSSARYVLVTHAAAKREASVSFFSRGCSSDFKREWEAEEKEWRATLSQIGGKGVKAQYVAEKFEPREEIMNKGTGGYS